MRSAIRPLVAGRCNSEKIIRKLVYDMANDVRRILPVTDHVDKHNTYKTHMEQYKKAMKYGFYFEAILIDYACMEDRLRAALFHIGLLLHESDYKVTAHRSKRVQAFREIIRSYDVKANLGIGSITGKRKIIIAVLNYVRNGVQADENDETKMVLYTKLNDKAKCDEILSLMREIEEWCGYRNEIIHSLMNKNIDSLHDQVAIKAEEGYGLFRQLDKQVQWIKKKQIRKALGMTTTT